MKSTKFILALAFCAASAYAYAQHFVAVGNTAKVFDEPNAKGYVTLNSANQEVSVLPGMVFKCLETTPGWYVVEYSPGLRGYISREVTVQGAKAPSAGGYKVSNNPGEKVTVSSDSGKWVLDNGKSKYSGLREGNMILFSDSRGRVAYSLVVLESGPVVMTYDNGVTRFF